MEKKLWFFAWALIILIIVSPIIYSDEIKIRTQEVSDKEVIGPEYVSDEILVKFKTGILPAKVEEIFNELNVTKISEIEKLSVHKLKIPSGSTVPEVVDRFEKNPFVEFAEPNYFVHTSFVPNDPIYSFQWHFDNPTFGGIHMESAWDITTGNSGVVVAVVDTGVAYETISGPGFWHIDTYNAFSGSSWWLGVNESLSGWTAFGGGSTPPGYGNGWKQYLQHSFDLTSATETVTFSYQYKFDIERNFDFFYVEVSDNNGQSWTILNTYTNRRGPPGGNDVDWTFDSVDLTSYIGDNILMRFRFNSDDSFSDEDGLFNSDGAVYIDEIRLEDGSGTLFFDNVEGGPGSWETTQFKQAPDLAGTSFVAGFDFVNNDSHPNDDNAHGTHVTGTIAQSTDNSLGVAGIAFSTSIMPVKVLNAIGTGTSVMVANGILFAADNGADIISMSLGSSGASSTIESAVNYSFNTKGVTIIAACGNSGVGTGCDYPAAFTNVISVGATQFDEAKAPYSSFGSNLDLVAPGGNTGVDQNSDGFGDGVLQQTINPYNPNFPEIISTPVDFSYWFFQGTSMATPHVSGVAALLLALDPTLTPSQIKGILTSTADDLGASGKDNTFGHGLLNAFAAVNSITPGEFVDITLIGYPLDFGNLNYGTANSPAPGNSGDQYKVKVEPLTNVNVDIYKKGNDFINGGSSIVVSNVIYDDDNDISVSDNEAILTNNYPVSAFFSNVPPNTEKNLYYWISVPSNQEAGTYTSTIFIKAVKTGTSP